MGSSSLPKKFTGQRLVELLPDELLLRVFSFLPDSRDRRACAAVSKKWLYLQLHMRREDFGDGVSNAAADVSRRLEGEAANDVRLAAMSVDVHPCVLADLAIFSSSSCYPPRHHRVVSDLGMRVVGFACSSLKSLALSNCEYVGNNGLACIANGCKSLEKLRIFHSSRIGDEGLSLIAKKCVKLSTLSLEACILIGDRSLGAFAEYSSQLESISLMKCPRVGDTAIVLLLSKLQKLAKLILSSMQMSDEVLKAIGEGGKSLEFLCLDSVKGPTETGYSQLAQAQKLRVLVLRSCANLTDASFSDLVPNSKCFTSLKRLEIKDCSGVTDTGLIELTKKAQFVEILKLEKCNRITTQGLMQALSSCSKTLIVLALVQCDLIGEPRQQDLVFESYPLLTRLKLKSCNGVGETFLSWIGAACKQAKKLALMNMSSLTDRCLFAFLKAMRGTSSVVSLDLSGCTGITDRSVAAVTTVLGTTLEILCLAGCKGLGEAGLGMIADKCLKLKELDLSRCVVRDSALHRLAGARGHSLRTLALAGCDDITDAGIAFVELMCPGLTGLNLMRCSGVSATAVESIRGSLWWCDLVS